MGDLLDRVTSRTMSELIVDENTNFELGKALV
jgi:hypothetical protein